MTRCYCGQEIADGDRTITFSYSVDWGDKDIREDSKPKTLQAHSFECIGKWAADRAATYDNTTLLDHEERPAEDEAPIVDTTTDQLVR